MSQKARHYSTPIPHSYSTPLKTTLTYMPGVGKRFCVHGTHDSGICFNFEVETSNAVTMYRYAYMYE